MSSFYKVTQRSAFVVVAALLCSVAASSAAPLGKPQGEQRPGWLGVMVRDVTPSLGSEHHLKTIRGAYVEEVVESSPADSAGLKEGDVVVTFNNTEIADAQGLTDAVKKAESGARVSVTIERNGVNKDIAVILGTLHQKQSFTFRAQRTPRAPSAIAPNIHVFISAHESGMQLETLGEQLAEYFGAPEKEGVLVKSVGKDTPAEKAGFRAGDVIVRVGRRPVDEVDIIQRELRKHKEGDAVEFEILRKGSHKVLSYTVQESADEDRFHVSPRVRIYRDGTSDLDESTPEGTQEFRIDMERMQRELRDRMEDLPRVIRKSIRIRSGSDV